MTTATAHAFWRTLQDLLRRSETTQSGLRRQSQEIDRILRAFLFSISSDDRSTLNGRPYMGVRETWDGSVIWSLNPAHGLLGRIGTSPIMDTYLGAAVSFLTIQVD